MRAVLIAVLVTLLPVACTSGPDDETLPEPTPVTTTTEQQTSPPQSTTSTSPPPIRPVSVDDVRVSTALAAVRHLAGRIGPRMATGPAYARAADWVARRLAGLGYDVQRQRFHVPGGVSWGVPVEPGRSTNVIATPRGFEPDRPHLVVGAHLDTVPQAPGAEDNASGIGVLLAAAEAVAGRRTELPVVFVAFGAEEPRGETDADHHYGSRHYVDELHPGRRSAIRGMVSLDRVGVGSVLPVSSADVGPDPTRAALLAAARRAGVRAEQGELNRSSDHWSFVRAGLPGARLGSTPYAEYHSAADVPSVVNPAQLRRAARTVVAWLSPR